MIIDVLTQFASATSIGTPNASTVNVGDVIDTYANATAPNNQQRDLGNGQPVYLVIVVTTAFTDAGSTAVSLLLSSDSTSTLSVDGTQTTHWRSDEVDAGQYTAGKTFVIPLPAGDVPTQVGGPGAYERYLGIQVQNTAAVAVSTGNITAFLTLDPTKWISYNDAVN